MQAWLCWRQILPSSSGVLKYSRKKTPRSQKQAARFPELGSDSLHKCSLRRRVQDSGSHPGMAVGALENHLIRVVRGSAFKISDNRLVLRLSTFQVQSDASACCSGAWPQVCANRLQPLQAGCLGTAAHKSARPRCRRLSLVLPIRAGLCDTHQSTEVQTAWAACSWFFGSEAVASGNFSQPAGQILQLGSFPSTQP